MRSFNLRIGPTSLLIQTALLHGSPGMHDQLRGRGVDISPPVHRSIATEVGTTALANAFLHVTDPVRRRMIVPDGAPIYARLGTYTHLELEHKALILEGLIPEKTLYEAVAFSAGMAAIDAAIETQVHAGEYVIFHMPVYGCTNRLANRLKLRDGRLVGFANLNDIDNIRQMIRPETTLLYGETQANPTLTLLDLGKIAGFVEEANKKGLTNKPLQFGVDNTFLTPVGLRVLKHGVRWVLNSGSKYFGGFMQHISGIVVAPQEMIYSGEDGLLAYRDQKGGVLDADAAHQVLTTGFTTLIMRVKWMEQVAKEVAEFLAWHEQVEKVVYAGLPTYSERELANLYLRDYDGNPYYGSMIYFELRGKTPEEAKERGKRLMIWLEKKGYAGTIAVSLGAVYTLVEHPASMTHASYTPEQLEAAGIKPGGIRIAVGTESPDLLTEELEEGLAFAYSDKPIESLG